MRVYRQDGVKCACERVMRVAGGWRPGAALLAPAPPQTDCTPAAVGPVPVLVVAWLGIRHEAVKFMRTQTHTQAIANVTGS